MNVPASSAWMLVPAGLGAVAAWHLSSGALMRRRARRRLFESGQPVRTTEPRVEIGGSWLERWLFLAGYRDEGAANRFLLAQGVALVAGVLLTLAASRLSLVDTGVGYLREIPGGLGDALAPVLAATPAILFFLVGLLPLTRVRGARRRLVRAVEEDLPMTLALLATLVESGLGFDAAVERVLTSMDHERPLAREFALFRTESRAGVPRLRAFRSMAERLDVVSMSTFVSAMVHAEHVGGGVAESLRRQADDVWSRRRELALQRAQTLPTKLSVPLVLCFLPGIFVYTFGPALAEFLRIADNVVNGAR